VSVLPTGAAIGQKANDRQSERVAVRERVIVKEKRRWQSDGSRAPSRAPLAHHSGPEGFPKCAP
jgi:hypothetical protein